MLGGYLQFVYLLCLRGGSEADDVSMLCVEQQRGRRQRLGGVSSDDVTAGLPDVDRSAAPVLLLSYRNTATPEARGLPRLKPQRGTRAGTAASGDGGLPDSTTDREYIEPNSRDIIPRPETVASAGATSKLHAGGPRIVVTAAVERPPSDNS